MQASTAVPAEGEVHVWWLSLVPERRGVEREAETLTREERERAARFRFARDRDRFVLGRSFLRTLLGTYTGEDPSRVRLGETEAGKPFLAERADVHFNISHCEDRGVLAVAGRPVGVDLERVREVADAEAIAVKMFGDAEVEALRAYSAAERSEAFLRCWTRKEAFVKGKGVGLSTPLRSFEVSLDRVAETMLLVREAPDSEWAVQDLEAPAGWVGALAIEGGPVRLLHRGRLGDDEGCAEAP
jgi:4'-phosphopantetheinyl transferase